MTEDRRIEWMDFSRTFAIISVLLCYSADSVYSMNMEEWAILSNINKIFSIVIHTTERLGVPVFIF
ncbi:hypothetical protein [uncultured Clostridium sp.]|uniref:hypothetical protein n=1 Tax=uncultured Clostridium sp. TaxID=59620 RepID=UPI0025E6577A|nr:hypothetical protein [uncultured Clostridium sp.]